MAEVIYDEQGMTAYLLGTLPPDDAERFDELSFTDDDFANRLRAAERDLVDAYVNDELSAAELERFETHYLASPMRRERVELAAAFQSFAHKDAAAAVARGSVPAVAEEVAGPTILQRFSSLFSVRRLSTQWGFAAALLISISLTGWLLVENSRLRGGADEARLRGLELERRVGELRDEMASQRATGAEREAELARTSDELKRVEQERDEQRNLAERRQAELANSRERAPERSAGAAIASFVLTPTLRGAGRLQTLSIPAGTGTVAVRLELEPIEETAFKVALTNADGGRSLWRSGFVKARGEGENKTLDVHFSAKILRSGQVYMLRIVGGAGEVVADYPFRVVLR